MGRHKIGCANWRAMTSYELSVNIVMGEWRRCGYRKRCTQVTDSLISQAKEHGLSLQMMKRNKNGMIVKNSEESNILTCLQANKLGCYSFTDACRRHKTTGVMLLMAQQAT